MPDEVARGAGVGGLRDRAAGGEDRRAAEERQQQARAGDARSRPPSSTASGRPPRATRRPAGRPRARRRRRRRPGTRRGAGRAPVVAGAERDHDGERRHDQACGQQPVHDPLGRTRVQQGRHGGVASDNAHLRGFLRPSVQEFVQRPRWSHRAAVRSRACASTSTPTRPWRRSRAPPSATRTSSWSPPTGRLRRFRQCGRPPGAGVVLLRRARALRLYEELALRSRARAPAVVFDYFGRTAGAQARRRLRVRHVAQVTAAACATTWPHRSRTLRERAAPRACSPSASASAAGRRGWPPPTGTASRAPSASTATRASATAQPGATQRAGEIAAPILALMAGDDQRDRPGGGRRARRSADRSGRRAEIVTYPGAPHSFFDRKQEQFAAESARRVGAHPGLRRALTADPPAGSRAARAPMNRGDGPGCSARGRRAPAAALAGAARC